MFFLFLVLGGIALMVRTFSEGATIQTDVVRRVAKISRVALYIIETAFAVFMVSYYL